jgi:nucleotide-binding universal stress UspA family protein
VATDGSNTATEAVRVAIELAKTFGATLHIASVYSSGNTSAAAWSGLSIPYPEGTDPGEDAAVHTDAMASDDRAQGVPTQTHVMPGFVVEQVIAIAAAQKLS